MNPPTTTIIDANTSPTMYSLGGGRLGQQVSRLLSNNPGQQLSLIEELAIARASVEDLVQVYEKETLDANGKLDTTMVVALGIRLRDALHAVGKLAERAFKIEQARAIEPAMVAALATHLNVMSANLLSSNPTLAAEFNHGLQHAFEGILNRAAGANAGTGIRSPSEIVAAMDASVPSAPPQAQQDLQAWQTPVSTAYSTQ